MNRPKRQRETTCRPSLSLFLKSSVNISAPPTIPVKKTKANDNGRKKVVAINTTADSDEQSDGDTVARDPSVGGNNVGLSQGTVGQITSLSVNNTVEMSRKEKRRVERAMRQSSILTMDDDEDEVTVAPTLSRSFDAAASKLYQIFFNEFLTECLRRFYVKEFFIKGSSPLFQFLMPSE